MVIVPEIWRLRNRHVGPCRLSLRPARGPRGNRITWNNGESTIGGIVNFYYGNVNLARLWEQIQFPYCTAFHFSLNFLLRAPPVAHCCRGPNVAQLRTGTYFNSITLSYISPTTFTYLWPSCSVPATIASPSCMALSSTPRSSPLPVPSDM